MDKQKFWEALAAPSIQHCNNCVHGKPHGEWCKSDFFGTILDSVCECHAKPRGEIHGSERNHHWQWDGKHE